MGVLQRLLSGKVVSRITSRIKPALTPQNIARRVEFVFEPMYDIVHVDEKWFYEDVDKHWYYAAEGEEAPPRRRRSKRFIPKTMYDYHTKSMFDGKIGIWPFTVDSVAQRSSVNRLKGDPITKNIESIDRNVYKDYLVGKVIPAIKAKWPRGWNVRLHFQPPNSPDFNVLDRGFFASIQSLQLKKGSRGIAQLVNTVASAYNDVRIETLENVFLSLQAVMMCALACNGGNEYKLPHYNKTRLRREHKLPESLPCAKDLYDRAAKEVNWLFLHS
uniref:DDE-1 domain-containing protein n=1 Tax=Phytophthora ramorum TaxID=164328 RepID=H3GPK9_PHYRM